MNAVEKTMIEKVHANVGVSGSTPAVDSENAASCSTCPRANAVTYNKTEISKGVESVVVSYLDRSMDQFETAMTDEIHNEVSNRPAAQQWAVCTP